MNLLANLLYAISVLFAFGGVVTMVMPVMGGFCFGVAWLSWMGAQRLKREARARAVRRQLGG